MIDFRLLEHHFQQDGWTQYHLFMRGTRWVKDSHTVIRDTIGYLYDGKRVTEDIIIAMMKIDENEIELYEHLKQQGNSPTYRFAFLDGVKWANRHLIQPDSNTSQQKN